MEFANVLVLNKTDLVTEEQMRLLEAILRHLNPEARMLRSHRGQVPLRSILNTGLFDMEAAQNSVGWARELNGQHTPETEEYGISSFVFRARRPFQPERLEALTDGGLPGTLRAKGSLWLATNHDETVLFSKAGSTMTFEPSGLWLAAD